MRNSEKSIKNEQGESNCSFFYENNGLQVYSLQNLQFTEHKNDYQWE